MGATNPSMPGWCSTQCKLARQGVYRSHIGAPPATCCNRNHRRPQCKRSLRLFAARQGQVLVPNSINEQFLISTWETGKQCKSGPGSEQGGTAAGCDARHNYL